MGKEHTFAYLATAEMSDLGLQRTRNEDALIQIPTEGVFCVADGIGGAERGDEASAMTVKMLGDMFDRSAQTSGALEFDERKRLVREAMNRSCRAIQGYCAARGYKSSGTTAVTIVFDKQNPNRAAVLHAGDSRAYRIRNHQIQQLTSDHTMEVEHGFPEDSAWTFGMRTIITRAVGVRPFVELDENEVDVLPGDVFMLCSDGLTRMLCDDSISRLIREQGVHDLNETVQKLVAEANYAGGHDNISVLLVRVDSPQDVTSHDGEGAPSIWDTMMRAFGRLVPGRIQD